ncbi:MAG: Gfo/Idh/MocA family oxidoreductase [Lachnospiraceae bacterium]
MAKTVKIGVVGCGGISNAKHFPYIKRNGNFEVVACCDIIEEKAQMAAKNHGIEGARVYTDYKELLEKETEVEAIYVLTPNKSHSFISVDAMHAGKHVLCEKPMAINTIEAQKMVDAAKETGKILTIGYQNRYSDQAQYLKKSCEEGELGEIYYGKAHALRRRGVPTWGVFLNEEEQGGGPLIDIGTHALDLTLYMMDNYEVESVTGSVFYKLKDIEEQGNPFGYWDPKKYTVEDSAMGFIKMKNGATIQLEASWALNTLDVREAQTSLCGTKAGADMKDGLTINYVKHNKLCVEKPDIKGVGVAFFDAKSKQAEDYEQETFYNAIVNGGGLCVKPEQAIVVTKVLEAIYESSKSGKTVYFD